MNKVEVKKIAMKNNGKIDLLTESQTPSTFLRNIRKTIATIERGLLKPEVAIFTLRLDHECGESEIKELSACIGGSIRDADYFARMSERGFWVVFHGNAEECEIAISRIKKEVGKRFPMPKIKILLRLVGEKREDWILRIDENYFNDPVNTQSVTAK